MKRIIIVLIATICFGWALIPAFSLDDVGTQRDPHDPNLFQFVRIRYNGYMSFWSAYWNQPPWAHDYPRAERNFLKILLELTSIETTPESFLVLDLHDPKIMNYPVLYVSEPGYWNITEEEADNLREYLNRGGFVIFDDFRGLPDWSNLVNCMQRVFPDRAFQELDLSHPVFHCFYDIETLAMVPPYEVPAPPTFYGMVDEAGRLQAVANLNNDIGDYWEWADDSLTPVSLSNEAFKFGINYVIYGMTH